MQQNLIFAEKVDLARLKLDDIDKLEITPIDLSKLSHVIKNDVKKSAFDKLVKKVNAIDSNTKSWKKSLKMLVNNAWCQ